MEKQWNETVRVIRSDVNLSPIEGTVGVVATLNCID